MSKYKNVLNGWLSSESVMILCDDIVLDLLVAMTD